MDRAPSPYDFLPPAPSFQASSTTTNIEGTIISINIYSVENDLSAFPGLTFFLDSEKVLNNPQIAYWDNDILSWIPEDDWETSAVNGRDIVNESSYLFVDEIPGWYDYTVLVDSDPLGVVPGRERGHGVGRLGPAAPTADDF